MPLKKPLGGANIVRVKVPIAGLEHLAAVLNEFERHPLMDDGQGVVITGDPATDARADLERVFRWLMRLGGIDDAKHVPLGAPVTIRPGEPPPRIIGLGEIMSAIAAKLLGADVLDAHVRRCEVCHRWMAARYANKRRHHECHARVFTREYRAKRKRARARQAAKQRTTRRRGPRR